MLEECPHCGAQVTFTGSVCPNCFTPRTPIHHAIPSETLELPGRWNAPKKPSPLAIAWAVIALILAVLVVLQPAFGVRPPTWQFVVAALLIATAWGTFVRLARRWNAMRHAT